MAQDVFERIEKKYMLSAGQLEMLSDAFAQHMRPDRFGRHTICNIYLDHPDFSLTRTSIEKPVYKEKLRLRSYGVPGDDDTVFLEIKKKYKGVVYKRRAEMTLKEAREYLLCGVRPSEGGQILNEIDYFMKLYRPQPMVYLCYDRIAYYCAEDPDLRITLDSNIRYRVSALRLEKGAWGTAVLPAGKTLMEIKIPGCMPLWMADALDRAGAYPVSFSKIGTVYEQFLMPILTFGGNQTCFRVS